MSDIFISYKREDFDSARSLAEALTKLGWTVWWDPELQAGEHFDDAIEAAIHNAICVLVIWSERSIKSQYVKEAKLALKLGKLIPIAIDDFDPPFRFQSLHTIQLQGWDADDLSPKFHEVVRNIQIKINMAFDRSSSSEPTADDDAPGDSASSRAQGDPADEDQHHPE